MNIQSTRYGDLILDMDRYIDIQVIFVLDDVFDPGNFPLDENFCTTHARIENQICNTWSRGVLRDGCTKCSDPDDNP